MTTSAQNASFLSAASADYIAELYGLYLKNPSSVDTSWSGFFSALGDEEKALLTGVAHASWTPAKEKIAAVLSSTPPPEAPAPAGKDKGKPSAAPASASAAASGKPAEGPVIGEKEIRAATLDSVRALMLIRAFRIRGHLLADLDPLSLMESKYHPELDPSTYGFTEKDFERPIFLDRVLGRETATLREILTILHDTYCGRIGVEFMHIQDPDQKAWIQEKIEAGHNHTEFTPEGKKAILSRVTAADQFERFLHTKYTGTKRFGLEGGEALVPAIEQIIKRGGQLGINEVVIGMAHRGRLNVLANVMGKPFTAIFSEFQGNPSKPEDVEGSGDVKYHMGTSGDRDFNGNVVHLSLTPNPSHLEAVNPVVLGRVRAKQDQKNDARREQVLALLLHGDAALAGQGVVAESMMLCNLPGYGTGGTIHFVINNQIGFTTSPQYSRSGQYSTDIAKMIQSPIFHVNGDDPEAVVHASRLAVEFRQRFRSDVFVDMICYRRHGHNESDEPAFTQPLMYKAIRNQPTTREIYAKTLVREGVLTPPEADKIVDDFVAHLEVEFKAAEGYKANKADMLEGHWSGIKRVSNATTQTALSADVLKKIGAALCHAPDGFNVNPKVLRQLEAKRKMFETGLDLDWATAEALAFGSLALEGYPVRLSGQDCGRGTFSQRHSVLVDQNSEQRYVPLNNIDPKQARYEVHDSPLSEFAVLGFEYGYSLVEPRALVLWEAQFGDFANGAQIIIDQFISSAESKWLRMSGLVMLLPHGYEGQGPEHSSARLERFLQLCGDDNIQVANCTTPANYFHILRRQMHREFRKPLVIVTPKSLFRHKLCVSALADMAGRSAFLPVIPDTLRTGKGIDRVVLCSGKVYYDLFEEREKIKAANVALVRIEQLYPFPAAELGAELAKYPAADVVWCQEEPGNMGAWHYIDRRIEQVLGGIGHASARPRFVGRPDSASPATGSLKKHNIEQAKLVTEALTVK